METTRRSPWKRAIAIRATVLLAAALLLAWGCCDGLRVKLSRVGDFLQGIIDLSGSVSIEGSSSFGGDFAAWADIPAFDEGEIEFDLTGAVYFEGSDELDVDYDAADEELALLRADGAVIFAAWRGDKYTADKGVCWLGWVEGGEAKLAAAWCGDDAGVMYCGMPTSGQGEPTCDLCESSSGACAACDMDARLSACLPPKPTSGSVDVDVDIDIDIDVDMDLDEETCGAP